MPSVSEQRALIERLQIVADVEARAALITRIATAQRPLTIAFLNQHAFNLANTNAEFRAALYGVDILLRDGVGISVALHLLGLPSGLNMNGTDFIPLLVRELGARLPSLSAYAFGTKEPWLQRGAQVLFAALATPAQCLDGFAEAAVYAQRLENAPAAHKLVVLAMGMPKQEQIAMQLKAVANGTAIIICGGAIIDFCAGKVRRAPEWIRYLHLEWLFRLALEPRRLFSRYVSGGLRFAASLLHLAINQYLARPMAAVHGSAERFAETNEKDTLMNKPLEPPHK